MSRRRRASPGVSVLRSMSPFKPPYESQGQCAHPRTLKQQHGFICCDISGCEGRRMLRAHKATDGKLGLGARTLGVPAGPAVGREQLLPHTGDMQCPPPTCSSLTLQHTGSAWLEPGPATACPVSVRSATGRTRGDLRGQPRPPISQGGQQNLGRGGDCATTSLWQTRDWSPHLLTMNLTQGEA